MSTAALRLADEAIAVGVGAPRVVPGLEQRLRRRRRHHVIVGVTDTAIIVAAATATAVIQAAAPSASVLAIGLSAAVVAAAWAIALQLLLSRARSRGGGTGAIVLAVLFSAAIALAALAIFTALTDAAALRHHVLVTIPAGACALVTANQLWRLRAHRSPRARALAPRTLVVGAAADVLSALQSLGRGAQIGSGVVGVALDDDEVTELTVDGAVYPVLGPSAQAAQLARTTEADTVLVVTGTADPDVIRKLSWSLEGAAVDLVLATRLTDVARQRIAFEHVDGLTLTHVSIPRFDGPTLRAKRALDIVVAGLALIPIGLMFPIVALLIAIDSPGGVLFRQRRVGYDGREFHMLKFRTMCATAEAQRAELAAHNEGAGPLFKMKNDPRVTRVGAVLRRFSVDELPQFWNVLRGDMSVVGPRPPLPEEVRAYDGAATRRLYVQPGITGLWQISGRSDLSWEQSVRLDLHYVENWSLGTDLRIILRTAAAMVRPKGAY